MEESLEESSRFMRLQVLQIVASQNSSQSIRPAETLLFVAKRCIPVAQVVATRFVEEARELFQRPAPDKKNAGKTSPALGDPSFRKSQLFYITCACRRRGGGVAGDAHAGRLGRGEDALRLGELRDRLDVVRIGTLWQEAMLCSRDESKRRGCRLGDYTEQHRMKADSIRFG